jgi:anti-anti-sigma factor
MTFTVKKYDEARTWQLSGELDVAETQGLIDEVGGSLPTEGDVHLDLTELTFIDSSGLRALVSICEMLPMGSKLVLNHPTPPVRRVLDLVGIEGAVQEIVVRE